MRPAMMSMARVAGGALLLAAVAELLASSGSVSPAGGGHGDGSGGSRKTVTGVILGGPASVVVRQIAKFRGQARLPRFAAPRRYDLRLRPDLVACTFTAAAVVVSAPTRFLVLNAADLSVDRASVRFRDLASKEVVFFDGDEILMLGFAKKVPLGEGVVTMKFNVPLNDQMRGFYRSKYQYKGKLKNMVVTQFEAVDARRCFPCWDEPAFKAKFKLTLEVPSEMVALSNMPVANQKISGPTETVRYEESPLMLTYLVAVVVGLFDYIEGVTSEGTKVRVYIQVGNCNQGKFALDVGLKSLDLYKHYFGTPYPLPKLDMVVILDFAPGAIENYGLVTFREVALLFDEQSSSKSSKKSVAITVAHELAHQWFGNLVTMEWWTHMWLNEGFAIWMSHLAVDSFFPQWNIWMQFLSDTTAGLKLDSLAASHPIEVEIHQASEVDEIFYAISYDKGDSIIRMLQNYLGAEHFQKALASYIKRYAYSNAKTDDLWAVLEEKSGEFVKSLMTTWTKQQGYPVTNAKLKGNYLEIEQVSLSVATISIDATPDMVGDIKQLLIKLLLLPAANLGWDRKYGESHLDAMIRPVLLDALVKLWHDETIDEGARRFRIFIHDRNTSLLPPDTRKAAYRAVMQNVTSSNRSGYDELLKAYRQSVEAEEKVHYVLVRM